MGTPAGDDIIRQWMDAHGLKLRKIEKTMAGGASPDQDIQFRKPVWACSSRPYSGRSI